MPVLPADTLYRTAGDTLAGNMAASLPDAIPPEGGAEASLAEPFGHLSPVEVFGPQSQLAPNPVWVPDPVTGLDMLTESLIFKLFVIAIFAGCCYLLYCYRDSLVALVKSQRSKLYGEKLIEDKNYTFASFLRIVGGMGLIACSVLIIRCAALFVGPDGEGLLQELPPWGIWLLPAAVVVVILFILLYQHLLLRAVGELIRAPLFFEHLRSLRRILAAIGIVFIAPLVLIFSFAPEPVAGKILYLILILLLLFAFLLIGKTRRYFAGEKVSIFYWILYLCTVEVFPVSIFAVLALRNL